MPSCLYESLSLSQKACQFFLMTSIIHWKKKGQSGRNKQEQTISPNYTYSTQFNAEILETLNIWWTFDSSESRHTNARVYGRRRHTCLQLAKGQVSRQALTCPSKPTSFLPAPGISVIPQAPLRSPTVYLKLLQLGLTHNTSPSQLKAMSGCIPTQETISLLN